MKRILFSSGKLSSIFLLRTVWRDQGRMPTVHTASTERQVFGLLLNDTGTFQAILDIHPVCKAVTVSNDCDEHRSKGLLRSSRKRQGAGTFRTIEFVTADAHEINLHIVDIKWNLSNSLGCISMEIHLFGTANLP